MTPVLVALTAGTIVAASAAAPSGRAHTFTTGSVGISTTPMMNAITFHGMAPGLPTTSSITVRNVGSLDLAYALTIVATDRDRRRLSSELELTIKGNVSDCSRDGFDVDGATLFGPEPLGTDDSIVAWSGSGAGAPGTARVLKTGDVEVLCVRVFLPASAGNAFQGAMTTASFRFDAQPLAG
jgi:hypothetical protein